jgi:hypothetical protein
MIEVNVITQSLSDYESVTKMYVVVHTIRNDNPQVGFG